MNKYLSSLSEDLKFIKKCTVNQLEDHEQIQRSDITFYLSYFKIVPREILNRSQNNLVVHESALPYGKGWSPLTWQVIQGKRNICVSLLEATDKVDSGKIYLQREIQLTGYELVEDLRIAQFQITKLLCLEFVEKYPDILNTATEQIGVESFFPKRTAEDSMLDINKTIKEQFNLLRTVDNEKYPAFFYIGEKRYKIKIEHF